jgi:hypothetical protein
MIPNIVTFPRYIPDPFCLGRRHLVLGRLCTRATVCERLGIVSVVIISTNLALPRGFCARRYGKPPKRYRLRITNTHVSGWSRRLAADACVFQRVKNQI